MMHAVGLRIVSIIRHRLSHQTDINDLILVVGDVGGHINVLHFLHQIQLLPVVNPGAEADEASLIIKGEIGDIYRAGTLYH